MIIYVKRFSTVVETFRKKSNSENINQHSWSKTYLLRWEIVLKGFLGLNAKLATDVQRFSRNEYFLGNIN